MIGFQPKNKRAASAEGAQAPRLGFPGKGPQSAGQAQALNQAPDSIPGMFKPGEFVLPPDTVQAMGGKEALGQVVQATHTPAPDAAVVPRGFRPEAFFFDGGAPEDRPRNNSFGDAAAAAADPSVTQVKTAPAPAPKPVQAPAPAQSAGAQMTAQPDPMVAHNQKLEAAQGLQSWRQSQGASSSPAARQNYLGLQQKAVDMQPSYFTQEGPASAQNRAAAESAASGALQSMYAPQKPAAASTAASNPYASVTPEQGRAMAEINSKAQSPEAAASAASTAAPSAAQQLTQPPGGYDPNQSRPDLGYGPIGDRTKLTNEQAATMNPAGRITATRGANGTMEFSGGNVSGQVSYNDASGKALPGGGLKGKGFSGFDVAPAGANVVTGPNGSYGFATSGSGLRDQGSQGIQGAQGFQGSQGVQSSGYTSDGIDTRGLSGTQADRYAAEVRQAQAINQGQAAQRGSWENRVAQWNDPFSGIGKARRNMETSMAAATTSSNKGMRGAGEKIAAARQAAYGELSKQHFGMAGGDRDDATRRHTSDNSLRGAQMQEAGQNQRADLGFRTAQQRAAIEGRRADSEITALGFKTREAQQYEQLRNVLLDPNATPEQRKVAQRSLSALSGKTAADRMQTVALPDTTTDTGQVVRGGQALVRTLEDGTVEQVPIGGQQPGQAGAAAVSSPEQLASLPFGALYVGPDGKQYRKN